jgi:hypothetical protein
MIRKSTSFRGVIFDVFLVGRTMALSGTKKRKAKSFNPPTTQRRRSLQLLLCKRELASLLGNWVYQSNVESDPECLDMLLSMPGTMQTGAATEQLNLEAAQKHLIQAYKDRGSVAYDILGQIGYRPAIFKASKDMRRFPDWKYLVAKILQMNLGTDTNIKHLFGDVSHVRGVLLQVGQMVAEPPPPNTPAYAIWHPILNQDAKPERVKPACAYCEKEEGENSSNKKMANV